MDLDGFPGNPRQGVRSAEDVDDVNRLGHLQKAWVAHLAENLRLAGIDWNYPVAMALEIEPNKVACSQLVRGQPDDRNRLRRVQQTLDRDRILISVEIRYQLNP